MPAIRRIARGVPVAFILAGVLFLAACGGGEDVGTVHGNITDIQTKSITEIESFSVLDEAGETWIFVTEGPLDLLGLTTSHLRQHMLDVQAVRVVFEREALGLVAVGIYDYP